MASRYPIAPRRASVSDRHNAQQSRLPYYTSGVAERVHRRTDTQSFRIPLGISALSTGMRSSPPPPYSLDSGRVRKFNVAFLWRNRIRLFFFVVLIAGTLTLFLLVRRYSPEEAQWTPTFRAFGESSTLVFGRDNLQRIWNWEIESGHYPTHMKIPEQIGLTSIPINPALPSRKVPTLDSRFRPPEGPVVTTTKGDGPRRVYLDIQSQSPNVAYPPRPVPGSVADLDIIMEHCDFSQQKYVRDCLEILRLGGGLDNGNRFRRGKLDNWKYIFTEMEADNQTEGVDQILGYFDNSGPRQYASGVHDPNAGLVKKRSVPWESPLQLPTPLKYKPSYSLTTPCDPENSRLFHMFWTGPFTDKPYIALLSFLFTQNLGLHLEDAGFLSVCRPQFWLWINPGPAASVPNPSAVNDMYQELKTNPWAAPFLHPRFRDVIKFKLWNTTEQLDGVPEIKEEWRVLSDTLFNSGGNIISVSKDKHRSKTPHDEDTPHDKDKDLLHRMGSKSSLTYDRLSVVLSDMARFVLCHRFGGIYLDADTIFLRDWEELWGWKGSFAYRWSIHDKYNTAVLRMHKNSALGSFLFRTALKNGLDFHPMTISRYVEDAHLKPLLYRIPDALFDSAWLNMEERQRERPPQPYFPQFEDFFDTPAETSAAPQALGFEGFFRGAYSYHFHNFWWKPFDPSRNWPDLGPRFLAGEKAARAAAYPDVDPDEWTDNILDDKRDLDWATVLKRTFEAYIRGERPNMYGEWLRW